MTKWLARTYGEHKAVQIKTGLRSVSVWISVGLCAWAVGCRPKNAAESPGPVKDAPLASFQAELLDLAFDAASAMPLDPHIKNRSRAQEIIVAACFELEQPQRALRYIEQIDNWRRGTGYADLAFFHAQRGYTEPVQGYLDLAAGIVGQTEDWRKDRIKMKIARVHTYMGQVETAARFQQGIAVSEQGGVARVDAMVCSDDAFDEKMAALGALVSTEQFDATKNALGAYTELFNRFYADSRRRAMVEEQIRVSWESMPIFMRIDVLKELAGYALAHADQAKALELVNEAKGTMDSARWQPRFAIVLMAQLAQLLFRAGDEETARTQVQEALNLFDAKRDAIVNIYRAQVLRPIAEAYQVMGDTAAALDVYRRAVEAGVENPNSRPRADDLAATCCSMAVRAAKPDEKLWQRMREIRDGLSDPW